MGIGILFTLIPLFIVVIFLIVISVFVMIAVKGFSQWKQNNASPVLTAAARVVSRRTEVTSNMETRTADNFPIQVSTHTLYFAAFEVESLDRMEFHISGQEYGQLAEGDRGMLTFQGSRYQGFQRMPDSDDSPAADFFFSSDCPKDK